MTVHWLKAEHRAKRVPAVSGVATRAPGSGATIVILPCVRREPIGDAPRAASSDMRSGTG